MKNISKSLIRLVILFVALVSVGWVSAPVAVKAVTVNDSNVFLKQQASYTCTLSSAAMMLRRRAIVDGNANWSSITESSIRSKAWLEGTGLYFNFSYAGMNVGKGDFPSNLASKKSTLINLLSKHPEGIEIYDIYIPHAILITDYDQSSGTFYCADPAGSAPAGRIRLTQSFLAAKREANQDTILKNCTMYWYITNKEGGNGGGTVSPNITISGANAPGTINVGNVFSISGTVNSGMPLTNVTAGVYDINGTMKTGRSASPNTTSYNIKNLDNYVYFNHLSAGVYTYKVTASNKSKSATLVSKVFIVLGKSRTIGDGLYSFGSKCGKGYGIVVGYESKDPGQLIHIWPENPNRNYMKWNIIYVGEGYYKIHNKGSGMAMEVRGGLNQNGVKIQQNTPSGNAAQLWQILPVGAYYCLVPKCATTCCLDLPNGSLQGANCLQTWAANMSNAQSWSLTVTSVNNSSGDNNQGNSGNKDGQGNSVQTPAGGNNTQTKPDTGSQTKPDTGAVKNPENAGKGNTSAENQKTEGTARADKNNTVGSKTKKSRQPMKVLTKTKKYSVAKLRKKAQTFKITVKKAKGKVTYKSSNKKYVKVTSKGKVTVKKKTPKGTYKITVRAQGSKKYNPGKKTVTIKVR